MLAWVTMEALLECNSYHGSRNQKGPHISVSFGGEFGEGIENYGFNHEFAGLGDICYGDALCGSNSIQICNLCVVAAIFWRDLVATTI